MSRTKLVRRWCKLRKPTHAIRHAISDPTCQCRNDTYDSTSVKVHHPWLTRRELGYETTNDCSSPRSVERGSTFKM